MSGGPEDSGEFFTESDYLEETDTEVSMLGDGITLSFLALGSFIMGVVILGLMIYIIFA